MGSENTTSVHLVLSAGGLKVISYVGALSLLAERNISFTLVPSHADELPILVLKPKKGPSVNNPKNVFKYVADLIDSSVGSHDNYVIKQIPRVRVIEIETGNIEPLQPKISMKEKEFLITQGRLSAEDELSYLGDDLSNINFVPEISVVGDDDDDIAEKNAELKITQFHKQLSNLVGEYVFISYSHRDREWLEKLQIHLKPYTRNASVTVWDDTKIKGGQKWRSEIENALEASKIAVLLVSPNFLASDFIATQELPPLLEAAEIRGLKILWIPISHSSYAETAIGNYQAVSGTDPAHPLDSLSEDEQDRILVKICQEIKATLGK